MLIVPVDDTHTALVEEHFLAFEIVLEIPVLVRPDVVWLDVGEDAVVKGESCCTVEHEAL